MRILFLLALLLGATAPIYAVEVNELPGYSRMTVSADFEEFLSKDKNLVRQLEEDTELSRLVMTRPAIQKQLMEKKVTVEKLVETYFPSRNEKTQVLEETTIETSQRNTEAKQLIARAQRAVSNPNARKRSQDKISDVVDKTAPTGITEEQLAQIMALAEQLRDQNGGLTAALNDAQIRAKLESGELTIEQLLAELGITLPTTPAPNVQTGGVNTQTVTPPIPATANFIDVNEIPSANALTDLDANGWPKYLQVPADCPAAKDSLQYRHFFSWTHRLLSTADAATRQAAAQSQHPQWRAYGTKRAYEDAFISPPLNVDEATTHITDAEVIAAPFITRNSDGYVRQSDYEVPGGDGMMMQRRVRSVSYCPGIFSNYTPQGEEPLSEDCRMATYGVGGDMYIAVLTEGANRESVFGGQIGRSRKACVLKPNKRYFYNLSTFANATEDFPKMQYDYLLAHAANAYDREQVQKYYPFGCEAAAQKRKDMGATDETLMQISNQQVIKGKEHYVCAISIRNWNHSGIKSTIPYSGECIGRPPYNKPVRAYPLNYDSRYCGVMDQAQGICAATRVASLNAPGNIQCYDPENIAQPAIFQRKCDASGKNMAWTKSAPAYSNYICADDAYFAGEAAGVRPCVASTEGDLVQQVCTFRGNATTHAVQQCQWNAERKRFMWQQIQAGGPVVPSATSADISCQLKPYDKPAPNKQTCRMSGAEHPLGTKMKTACYDTIATQMHGVTTPEMTEVRECRQSGVSIASTQPIVPVFQIIEGGVYGKRNQRCEVTFEAP